MKTDVEELKSVAMESIETSLSEMIEKKAQSPIETMFFWAALSVFGSYFHGQNIRIIPQKRIGKYRVDFLIGNQKTGGVIVECDGHEFHERTKEQAQRDRSRDRTLQAEGLPVFRFTGSEINRDIKRCAEEVGSYIRARICKIDRNENGQ